MIAILVCFLILAVLLAVVKASAILTIGVWLIVFYLVARAFGRWMAAPYREVVRRMDNDLCLHCGYDKRSDPRGRCPECGRF